MSTADGAPSGCPVCGLGVGPQPACAECGWILWSQPELGPVTAELERDFNKRLTRKQQLMDAAAAAAAAAATDRARYRDRIRGGAPDRAGWAAAQRSVQDRAAGAEDEASLRGVLAAELSELSASNDMVVVEIDPAGVTVAWAVLDGLGFPQVRRDSSTLTWGELLPVLSADPVEATFQLAGGLAGVDREELGGQLDEVWTLIGQRALLSAGRGSFIVICRPAGWPVLERVALGGRRTRPTAKVLRVLMDRSVTADAGLLDDLIAAAPLTIEYGVVVAAVDQKTREVKAETIALFRPGDGQGQQAELLLRHCPGDHGDVTLAVVVGGSPDAPPLSVWSVPYQSLGSAYRLKAVLDGPGKVRMLAPPDARPDTKAWPEILTQLPQRVDVVLGPIDLVCAIELAGEPELVGRRRELVRELLEILQVEYLGAGLLRVGVLGCVDHRSGQGRKAEHRQVLRWAKLATVGDALGALAALPTENRLYPRVAPIEDMLDMARRWLAKSQANGRAARLLTVASRPPHPHTQAHSRGDVLPCPEGIDWRSSLSQIIDVSGASSVAVVDERGRSEFWRELGRDGLHILPSASARRLGEDLGVLVRDSQRIGIPLLDNE